MIWKLFKAISWLISTLPHLVIWGSIPLTSFEIVSGAHFGRVSFSILMSITLVGGPISSYSFYLNVRRLGRPALSTLLLATTLFFSLMSLGVAELGAPISDMLTRPPSARPNGDQRDLDGRSQKPADRRPDADATARSPGVLAKMFDRSPSPKESAQTPSSEAEPAPSAQPYSLYDMLTLIGLVGTVTLVLVAALVPEESRTFERRRDDRIKFLDNMNAFSSRLHAYHEHALARRLSRQHATDVWEASIKLYFSFQSSTAFHIKEMTREVMSEFLVDRVRSGGFAPPDGFPSRERLTRALDRILDTVDEIELSTKA